MCELWDLYDIHRDPTGETWERGSREPIPQGLYHVIVSIWTVTPDGRVLITKRHDKKSFGGLWENTGGAVVAGETSVQAAFRELLEETGLSPSRKEMLLLGEVWHPGSIIDAYMYVKDVKLDELKLQKDEVVDARLMLPSDIDEIHRRGDMVPSVYKTFCCYRDNMKEVLGLDSF